LVDLGRRVRALFPVEPAGNNGGVVKSIAVIDVVCPADLPDPVG
jgi:hypothetical protein